MKSLKLDPHLKVELIPIEVIDSRRVKNSFKKLMRACVPPSSVSTGSSGDSHIYHKHVEESEWLQGLQNLLQITDAVLDLMDIEKSSVMIALEDGWDVTPQITSIAQLCMDPFYRTIKGFRTLIEKEWLSLGHRFQHRSNLTAAGQDATFTPIFLQFLDTVHQIHNQCSMAFEFNQFFLRYLAYHYVSSRFNTFVFDNEMMRFQFCSSPYGDSVHAAGDKHSSDHSDDESHPFHPGTCSSNNDGPQRGIDIFDYIDLMSSRSPMFYNFDYSPDSYRVIRPQSKLGDLEVWKFYFTEELNMGPVNYEFDLSQYEGPFAAEDIVSSIVGQHCGEYMISCFDSLPGNIAPSSFDLLMQIVQLESQLGHVPRSWNYYWDHFSKIQEEQKLPDEVYEYGNLPLVMRTPSSNVLWTSSWGAHKPYTVEVLLRGRIGNNRVHICRPKTTRIMAPNTGSKNTTTLQHRLPAISAMACFGALELESSAMTAAIIVTIGVATMHLGHAQGQ